ncbi:MAG: EAL domain-containing protein [Pseudomonadota bacterium]
MSGIDCGQEAARASASSDAAIALRKAFLEIGAADAALLAKIHPYLLEQRAALADAFYAHLLRFPEMRSLLNDAATVERLKRAQARYFAELSAGDYGADYVRKRLRIGQVHQRIGLAPHWYMGAFRKYLSELMPMLWQALAPDAQAFMGTYDAMVKLVCFDMSLALDAYFLAEQEQVLQLKLYAEQVVANMPCGLLVIDSARRIRSTNLALRAMLGPGQDSAHVDLSELLRSTELMAAIAATIAAGADHAALVVPVHGPGGTRHLQWTISAALLASQGLLLLMVEDISSRKQVEDELRYLAGHDALTGLANRTMLLDRLAQAIVYASRAGKVVAVLLIDLDRFKNINDSLGHDAGDQVIVETGRRLLACVRDGDTVARLGGDEFVVVLADVAREDDIGAIVQAILAALGAPMDTRGQELVPAGSIGVSIFPKDGADGQALLSNADAAMYRAKNSGRGGFQFYQSDMNARTLERLKLEGGLRHAIERAEFIVHYQPQVDIATGAVLGVEALLRWQPPGRALLFPAEFISIAEETGLIVPIGEWVLHSACAARQAWQRAGAADLKVAVNLSARQFHQQALEVMVARVLAQTGCPPACLELEITESVVMEHPEAAIATLRALSDMGVKLSIDDFGTGYSSLNYLKRFPIHTLKIDRSFVTDISRDADDAAIATAVIALAHSMKLTVVAEGVETLEQLEFLRAHGCDQMQGYYFSKPLPDPELLALLARRPPGASP